MRSRASNSDAPKSELLAVHPRGGFSDEVKAGLKALPDAVAMIASRILERNYPESP